MRNLICPVSPEKVNESVVRLTALWTVMMLGLFLVLPNPYIPIYLAFDFYVRAYTRAKFSPLSWLSNILVRRFKLPLNLINKAPKIFAARIGLLFSILIFTLTLFNFGTAALITASVLVVFAFLECGINFCAGCWVYTFIVLPLYRDKD